VLSHARCSLHHLHHFTPSPPRMNIHTAQPIDHSLNPIPSPLQSKRKDLRRGQSKGDLIKQV